MLLTCPRIQFKRAKAQGLFASVFGHLGPGQDKWAPGQMGPGQMDQG